MRKLGLLLPLLLVACSKPAPKANPFITGKVMNIAHQGGEELWPSNTMLAYKNAAALGVDMLDMDMHSTKDGVLVLSHDDTLDCLTDRVGKISELTYAEVGQADAGYRLTPAGASGFPFRGQGVTLPKVRDILTTFPTFPMTIEIKEARPSVAQPFCDLLRETHMTAKVIVASFSDLAMNESRAACPEVTTSMTEKELKPLVILSKVGLARFAKAAGQVAQVPVRSGSIEIVTPSFVRAMHARGIAVHVWTINDEPEMRRLAALGVDGIMSDRPDLLKKVLSESQP
ncbi:glycerophosphodiester phosphodiesterase [Deinococcus xinjiangensis]|uniref:Glycerophosphodiester phosphodiesterase n=1 Tax=Deinococcus xinjiangensis TaxID=457454 RepID=A0ABP9VD95_9DEIO